MVSIGQTNIKKETENLWAWRIKGLSNLDDTFKLPKDFSAAEYFETMYGIVSENLKPQRVILRAYDQHMHYIKSLPIHHSQRLITDTAEYADFELYITPTYDFIMRLLHDGAWLEVMSPVSLRKAIKGWIGDMYDMYESDLRIWNYEY